MGDKMKGASSTQKSGRTLHHTTEIENIKADKQIGTRKADEKHGINF